MPKIELIATGVPGLDRILGGGLPSLSFNVIGGDPGAGKTTLAHQIIFANATEERPALFCTVVGEPPIKMLRYQQQYDFYDAARIGKAVHYQSFADRVLGNDLEGVVDEIGEEMERLQPAFVVVDSFSSVSRMALRGKEPPSLRFERFMQRLAIEMTRWEATTFLLGEFSRDGELKAPLFTVADGVLWLRHAISATDSRVRKLEVAKLRGQGELPGLHTYRISDGGVSVYPRELAPLPDPEDRSSTERASTGIEGLDEMMSGGPVQGDAVIVSGPSGVGKSVLGMQFARTGLQEGESVVVAVFEESDRRFRSRARSLGLDLLAAEDDDRLRVVHRRPLDLSVDETFESIRNLVDEIGAKRVVIDSLSGLQVMANGAEADRLRESVARLVLNLTEGGVTVLMTAELNQDVNVLRFTPHETSFLADDVILFRYVEVRGELETVVSVVKMRRSGHRRTFHRYTIDADGLVVGEALANFHGILTGVPELDEDDPAPPERDSPGDGSSGPAP